MNVDEDSVRDALRTLQDNSLAGSVSAVDSRVTKYEHRLQEAFNFDRREAALFWRVAQVGIGFSPTE
jgi:uncharacterized protein YceH (UPF0502 family)